MLGLLHDVSAGDGHLYAALFELGDRELVAALAAIGERAHVVLANGSIEAAKGEPARVARLRDENAEARQTLIDAGVQVSGRFVSPGALAHNKFAVVTTASDEPTAVWTGSTNWTTTGLCTQLNNGLLVRDGAVAALYRDQWNALRDAGSEHPSSLAMSNSTPGVIADPTSGAQTSVHFTRAKQRADLAALREIVLGAQTGVLFLMFIPGASGVLADVRELAAAKPGLLVRGVVSELPRGRADEKSGDTTTVRVSLIGTPDDALGESRTFDVVQPQAMTHHAAGWAIETTRQQFQGAVGHAIIHSKVLVVDPFHDNPVVVTCSHNFSISASEKNDENFIVVKGRPLAEAYAVNIHSAWRHYAGRIGAPHPGLAGIEYLRALLADNRHEEHFWKLNT